MAWKAVSQVKGEAFATTLLDGPTFGQTFFKAIGGELALVQSNEQGIMIKPY